MATDVDDILGSEYRSYKLWVRVGGEDRHFEANLDREDSEGMPEEARRALAAEALMTQVGDDLGVPEGQSIEVLVRCEASGDESRFHLRRFVTVDWRVI